MLPATHHASGGAHDTKRAKIFPYLSAAVAHNDNTAGLWSALTNKVEVVG